MSKIEYDMPDNYNEMLAKLLEMIETQKFYDKEINFLQAFANVDELRTAKAEQDKCVDEFEQALALEYEAYQRFRKSEDELEQALYI
jgi:endonuclease IV